VTQSDAGLDAHWMRVALAEAKAAETAGEVPVGAVVVCQGRAVATGRNAPISTSDPTAHAEMLALRAAAQQLGNYRLEDCELFVTLEPCNMCAGAILHARLKRVVFGAADLKTGAAGSVTNLFAIAQLNHQTQIQGGVLSASCTELLQRFFRHQRSSKRLEKIESGRALRDDALRTPAQCFHNVPDLSVPSRYVGDLPSLNGLRLHYLDTGPVEASSACLYLHGPRDWCCVWQDQLMLSAQAGIRAICPDLIGFGKSDKPKKMSFHQLQWHAQVTLELVARLQLDDVTLILPESMSHLAQLIQSSSLQCSITTRYSQPQSVPLATLLAPFPDSGHQAAWRAFDAMKL